ncbi:hypothetical protein J6590_091395 [Homalodisca vitripennis]|nr:hypothetical protein J6590_091395 [Homalodisca vitripennis]
MAVTSFTFQTTNLEMAINRIYRIKTDKLSSHCTLKVNTAQKNNSIKSKQTQSQSKAAGKFRLSYDDEQRHGEVVRFNFVIGETRLGVTLPT